MCIKFLYALLASPYTPPCISIRAPLKYRSAASHLGVSASHNKGSLHKHRCQCISPIKCHSAVFGNNVLFDNCHRLLHCRIGKLAFRLGALVFVHEDHVVDLVLSFCDAGSLLLGRP